MEDPRQDLGLTPKQPGVCIKLHICSAASTGAYSKATDVFWKCRVPNRGILWFPLFVQGTAELSLRLGQVRVRPHRFQVSLTLLYRQSIPCFYSLTV
jgi:hypothetical protein